MQVDILTPETSLFSGEAFSVIFPGIAGGFQLLENHAPIIAALKKGTIIIASDGSNTSVEIEDGFVECLQNKVSVLVSGGSVSE